MSPLLKVIRRHKLCVVKLASFIIKDKPAGDNLSTLVSCPEAILSVSTSEEHFIVQTTASLQRVNWQKVPETRCLCWNQFVFHFSVSVCFCTHITKSCNSSDERRQIEDKPPTVIWEDTGMKHWQRERERQRPTQRERVMTLPLWTSSELRVGPVAVFFGTSVQLVSLTNCSSWTTHQCQPGFKHTHRK